MCDDEGDWSWMNIEGRRLGYLNEYLDQSEQILNCASNRCNSTDIKAFYSL